DGGSHVRRFPGDRDLVGPSPDWLSATLFKKWLAVAVHLFLGKLSQDCPRQDALDENILIDDQIPTDIGSAKSQEHLAHFARHRLQVWEGHQDGFEKGNRLHIILVTHRIVKAQRRSPVVYHESEVA